MSMADPAATPGSDPPVSFETHPSRYRHWRLEIDGLLATLVMDVDESAGIRPGYRLKLNSYDLGVDIELHDALQRIRFEHPQVRAVILTSGKERIFCSGANIFMLGLSSHAWKVNFCKFTNETRNGIEDSSRHSGLKFLAACNGTTAGGGYELALACDEIVLVDDRSSAVSLPEVPLLGVLPGTGGLTRLTDKRRVRRDRADVFCTTVEGVRGQRARDWGLVDAVVKPQSFKSYVRERALVLAAGSERPRDAEGVALAPLERRSDASGLHYRHVDARLDVEARRVELQVSAPETPAPATIAGVLSAGSAWWPLAMARELDDAILSLRTNYPDFGLWILRTRGPQEHVLAVDRMLVEHRAHWFVREVIGQLRRTLARLDVSSRSLFALIEPSSCFAGTLLELALAADRVYMLNQKLREGGPTIALSEVNFGLLPAPYGRSRIEERFYGDAGLIAAARAAQGHSLESQAAESLGLVTSAPDDLDWEEEIRIALEERGALSPDALSGMEANLRFGPEETLETRIFGRLSAWQNWIFSRPNAVGEAGALKVFGTGRKARFDRERI
ncbi:MAG TPA: 2,3-epoxybenzoyl-CoA dihydrolase [Steroidobacteraceae bacterium]|nr:2,3-epoxybenzoyl-CoA dihydrolase [Steroidobacteraceae bacterium]